MTLEHIEAVVLATADPSDPLNNSLMLGIRAQIDGKKCGWRATVERSFTDWNGDMQKALAVLIREVIEHPAQSIDVCMERHHASPHPRS